MADQDLRELERLAAGDPTHEAALMRARTRAGLLSPAVLAYTGTLVSLPTFEQTMRFVEWVAAARSWYKHLDRLTPFQFHLDPFAACACDRRGDGAPHFSIVLEEHRFHHSFRTSKEWWEQFGCWALFCGDPPDDPEEERARAVFDGANWILVPEEFGGMAMVNGDIYHRRFGAAPTQSGDPEHESAELGRKQLLGMLEAATNFREAVQRARGAL